VPRGLQRPRVPIMVGGNGQNVTWRLAARYADELNVDGCSPEELRAWLPIIHARCEEIGRDRATLALSVNIWHEDLEQPGHARINRLAAFSLAPKLTYCEHLVWDDGPTPPGGTGAAVSRPGSPY
jgi:alkanesulfonate monooxygenase SsuD/methylene tetrahydromethanopterin reductase-like flavin-dependent oxidoreductase (luciferase family)